MANSASSGVPAAAAAVGYSTETFGPAVTLGSNWQLWTNAANVTQNGDGSVTIAGGGNGYNNAQVATATPNGSGSLNGEAFGGGGYFEATLSFVGTPVTNGGWPSFWANDIENQINAQTGNGASQWQGQANGYVNSIETDFMEYLAGQGAYGFALHHWYGQQSAIQAVHSENSGSPAILPPGTDTSQPHAYGFLWMPATSTTQGYAKWYFDNVQVGSTVTWNQYNPATPPDPREGSSAYSVLDARHLYLILGTGPSNPMTVYNVKVWQKSTANDIGTLQTTYTPGGGGDPTATPSPDGTKIRTAAASPIIDQAGNRWTLVQSASKGSDRLQRLRRSGHRAGRSARNARRQNGQENSYGDWFSETGRHRSMVADSCARRQRSPVTPSPDGTRSPPPRQARSLIRPAIAGPSSSQRRRDCRSPATASSTRSPRRSSCSKLSAAKSSRGIPTVTGSQNQGRQVHGRRSLRLPRRY
jgi:hypothetical protein